MTIDFFNDKVQDECGVFGIFRRDDKLDLPTLSRDALYALQHRGQESAGIALNFDGQFTSVKNVGMVSEVLTDRAMTDFNDFKENYFKTKEKEAKAMGEEYVPDLSKITEIAVAHVRHTPNTMLSRASSQPLVIRYIKGSMCIALNGYITNFCEIRRELEDGGAIFQSNTNAELVAYVVAVMRISSQSFEEAVRKAAQKIEGSYSFVISSPDRLIAVRDPHGFRPLCLGKIQNTYAVASESCAFDSIGARTIRHIKPGEMVVIDKDGLSSYQIEKPEKESLCLFEYIYIARPDSILDCGSVHYLRKEFGRELAREFPIDADIVSGVPDSGSDASQGYAEESGIPYSTVFVKNKYIGRNLSNVKDNKKERLFKMRLNVLSHQVKGKRVIIVDDSIVKGDTIKYIVTLLRNAGASEVHVRISSPQMKYNCYFGSDLDDSEKMFSNRFAEEDFCSETGADSIGFIDISKMKKIAEIGGMGVCDACFTGKYPAPTPKEIFVDRYAQRISRIKEV